MPARFIGLALAAALAGISCAPKRVVSAPAGPPRLVQSSSIVLPLLNREEYDRLAELKSASPSFARLTTPPERLDADTRYSILPLADRSVTITIHDDPVSGNLYRIDFDGDGDVLDDTAYRVVSDHGQFTLELTTVHSVVRDEGTRQGPLLFRLVDRTDAASGRRVLLFEPSTLRRGTIRVGTLDVEFGLLGEFGEYDQENDLVAFDLNRDGALDLATPQSLERHSLAEGYVNLGGRSFAFDVDALGDRLTLERLPRKLPDRVVLADGGPAPDFRVVDVEGRAHRLSDYRGRVLLLDFWGTWCKPCVDEAPRLVELYEANRARGFEILGIHVGGDEASVRAFTASHRMGWPQALHEHGDPLLSLYRVGSYPTLMLIDRQGKFVSTRIGVDQLRSRLDELLGPG